MIGEKIADLAARINVAEYEMLSLIAEFDEREGWAADGFGSCAEWLAWRIGVRPMTARERVRAALALRFLPKTSAAMKNGELSFSKVRALTRVAKPESEDELLELARAGSAANLERVVQRWRRMSDKQELNLEQRRQRNRSFSMFVDEDGMYIVKGRLTPEVGAVLMRAIEAASDELFQRETNVDTVEGIPPAEPAQRRADGVGLLAELALRKFEAAERKAKSSAPGDEDSSSGSEPRFSGTRAERYQVMVHVGIDTLARGETPRGPSSESDLSESYSHLSEVEGVRVSAETSRRICCDAALVRIGHGEKGQILDVGRRTRSIPAAIRRALEARDRGCRFPGCGSRYTACHHVQHWVDGGETKLTNLLLLCPRHHTVVHEGDVRVVMNHQGKTAFFTPEGRTLRAAPPRVRNQGDAGCLDDGPRDLPELHSATGKDPAPIWRTGGPKYKRDSQIPWEIEARGREALG